MNTFYTSNYDYFSLYGNGYFILGVLIVSIIFGAICQNIGTKKGRKSCFWWGFLFGFIGLIVVLCLSDKSINYVSEKDKYDNLEKLENLREKGTISNEEYEIERKKILK